MVTCCQLPTQMIPTSMVKHVYWREPCSGNKPALFSYEARKSWIDSPKRNLILTYSKSTLPRRVLTTRKLIPESLGETLFRITLIDLDPDIAENWARKDVPEWDYLWLRGHLMNQMYSCFGRQLIQSWYPKANELGHADEIFRYH